MARGLLLIFLVILSLFELNHSKLLNEKPWIFLVAVSGGTATNWLSQIGLDLYDNYGFDIKLMTSNRNMERLNCRN
jgi:hypothetical protein